TGSQAHQLGLVDELGSLRTAIAIAKEKAGIDGKAGLVHRPRQATFLEQLLGTGPQTRILAPLLDSSPLASSLPPAALRERAQQVLTHLPFFAEGKPVLMSPYHVHVH
ncbi:MAG: hypothetical protein VX498_09315, partial [Myxococcota bacterium]|nr:hypothetical protein [Myxococcota bacterium]